MSSERPRPGLAVIHTGLGRVGGGKRVISAILRTMKKEGIPVDLFYQGPPFAEMEDLGNRFPRSPRPRWAGRLRSYLRIWRALGKYDALLIAFSVEPLLLAGIVALHRQKVSLYLAEPLRALWEAEVSGEPELTPMRQMRGTILDLYGTFTAQLLERESTLRMIVRVLRALDYWTIRAIPRRAAISRFTARVMEQVYRVQPTPPVLYPPWIHGDEGPMERAKPTDGEPIVLCVGALMLYKNHVDLLTAWKQVEAESSTAELVLVGDGPLRSALEQEQRSLGLRRVRFLGSISAPALAALYARAAVLVHPALSEAFGMTPLEAAVYRVPSVVTDSGGITEFVENGRTGRVVPRHDPPAMSQAVLELLRNPSERERMGAEAYRRQVEWPNLKFAVGRLAEIAGITSHRSAFEGRESHDG